jgi:hypothetical protein
VPPGCANTVSPRTRAGARIALDSPQLQGVCSYKAYGSCRSMPARGAASHGVSLASRGGGARSVLRLPTMPVEHLTMRSARGAAPGPAGPPQCALAGEQVLPNQLEESRAQRRCDAGIIVSCDRCRKSRSSRSVTRPSFRLRLKGRTHGRCRPQLAQLGRAVCPDRRTQSTSGRVSRGSMIRRQGWAAHHRGQRLRRSSSSRQRFAFRITLEADG